MTNKTLVFDGVGHLVDKNMIYIPKDNSRHIRYRDKCRVEDTAYSFWNHYRSTCTYPAKKEKENSGALSVSMLHPSNSLSSDPSNTKSSK